MKYRLSAVMAAAILTIGAPLRAQYTASLPPSALQADPSPTYAYSRFGYAGGSGYRPLLRDGHAAEYGSNYRGAHPFGAYTGGPDPGGTFFSR